MDTYSLQSSTLTTITTPVSKNRFITNKICNHGQFVRFRNFSKFPQPRKLKFLQFKAQASSGTTKFSSPGIDATPKEVDLKDENLAFVAGATGRVGSRTVRELLKLGFQVRAGVRNAKSQGVETLVQSVKQLQVDVEGAPPVERLEIVECDLEKQNQIGPALGNSSVVLCCIGASEKEVFDITGPYRIDYQATKNLIDAATVAKAKHFIMVSSLGTNKVGFPAAILNLFWGVLIWKRKAEEALIVSGLPYTIVRPGGMERPTDAYKETHNLTLSLEDTLFGGQVSNLQIAELIAFMAKNRSLSYCKVVEAIAETTAPLTPTDKLLEKIPSQRVEPKESVATDEPKTSVSEPPSAPIEMEPVLEKPAVPRPLSPYSAYEDLKPPTSPCPTPSSPKEIPLPSVDVASPVTGGNNVPTAVVSSDTVDPPPKLSSSHSPFLVYDDLKPPTSPSPSAPVGAVLSGNNTPPTAPTDNPHHVEAKPRPLSPYAMYDDLKPPTSPSPSSPRK